VNPVERARGSQRVKGYGTGVQAIHVRDGLGGGRQGQNSRRERYNKEPRDCFPHICSHGEEKKRLLWERRVLRRKGGECDLDPQSIRKRKKIEPQGVN